MQDYNVSPFNQLPKVIIALAVVIFGLEMMFQLATAGLLGGQGGVGWRLAAINDFGVFNEIVDWMIANNGYPSEFLIRFVTYPLIHQGFVHALFVTVFILAIGKMVAEVFAAWAVLVVFFGSAIIGALGFTLLLNSPYPLIGGYPGVYGLIGAFTFLLWVNLAGTGATQYRAFSFIGILLVIQVLFALLQGDFGSVVSDLSGFVAGFLMSFVVSPGGWSRVVAKLRNR